MNGPPWIKSPPPLPKIVCANLCIAVSLAACSLLSHKMDEYDEMYTYLESGTYPEGLSKDGNIINYHDLG